MSKANPTYPELYRVIMKNMKLLKKAGVLTARPGYEITGGKVTYHPAIVVTVVKKKKGLRPQDKLPAEIGDIPVDVREATPMQLLRDKDPDSFQIIQALGPRELHEPESKWECSMHTGKLVAGPSAKVKALIHPPKSLKKTPVPYQAPAGVPLNPVTANLTITAYASPDNGYTVLSDYLKATQHSMTVGMYDFTSGDLLHDVIATLNGKQPFTMVLDHPTKNDTANQTDEVTRKDILASDPKAAIDWALSNTDPEVTGSTFPHAYHIKVVVRDQSSFWLSSGNFNVSNQPNLAVKDPKRGSLATSDRDWHVIVEHPGLANLFEKFIQNDFKRADPFQAGKATAAGKAKLAFAAQRHKTLEGAMKALKTVSKTTKKPPPRFKPPTPTKGIAQKFPNVLATIQPLLTPDPGKNTSMYIDNVLALIQSAKQSIHVQMQYINPPPKAPNNFSKLINALADAHNRGLVVRIIVNSEHLKDISLEALSVLKLDVVIRKQPGVHNKGIIIDGTKVLVSSQNWSSEGVMFNRDAGVIIDNKEIATYFEAIFNDDWTNRAK